jgi:hypothetical protein
MNCVTCLTYIRKWLKMNDYAFAFSKKRLELQRHVNAVLQEAKGNGTLRKLEAKWFGAGEAVKVLPSVHLEGNNGANHPVNHYRHFVIPTSPMAMERRAVSRQPRSPSVSINDWG